MQLLDPLAILDIAFATGYIFEVMGIDQFDLKAAVIEDFKNGDPIDACRLHGHGIDAAFTQPVGQGVQVNGEGLEASDGLMVPIRGNTGPDFGITNV